MGYNFRKKLSFKVKQNVLEVALQKDSKGGFSVSDGDCAKLLTRIGLDQRPGVHLEEIQICPNGKGVILITLRKGVDITKFCTYDVLEVTTSGMCAVNIKQAGRKDAVITVKGIHLIT